MILFYILDEDDLSKVIDEIHTIQSRYYYLGRSLNLKIPKLRNIRDRNPSESDALEDVLLLWLEQEYNVAKHGPPTWKMLVEAVDQESGGDNHELAKKIASKHQTDSHIHDSATGGAEAAKVSIVQKENKAGKCFR